MSLPVPAEPVATATACAPLISAAQAVAAQAEYAALRLGAEAVYGVRYQPSSGRNQLCSFSAGKAQSLLPDAFSVRSRVHEYGGGAWCLAAEQAFFVNDSDQQLWQLALGSGELRQLTDEPGLRFADLLYDDRHQRVLAVCEALRAPSGPEAAARAEPINRLVAVTLAGQVRVLAEGADFYSSPALSPDGRQLAWIEWDHPQQPWRCTRLRLALIDDAGEPQQAEMISDCDAAWAQPRFAPDGTLHTVVDRNNWWRIECFVDGHFLALDGGVPDATEFTTAPWQFGLSTYGWDGQGNLLALGQCDGFSALYRHGGSGWQQLMLDRPVSRLHGLACGRQRSCCIAEFGDRSAAILQLLPAPDSTRCQSQVEYGGERPAYPVSLPQAQRARLANGEQVPFFLYRPLRDTGRAQPLIIYTHGGPTAATAAVFKPALQFWTQRGFLVADVNYRGSTGYGRDYRLALAQRWGVSDVEDVEAVARALVAQDLADPAALFIRGNSAGGYTTLSALARSTLFTAGTSLYGVSDPARLNVLTHKFESHYLSWLIGDPLADAARYLERSPLQHADRIRVPVLFFQGERDRVVLPEQTRLLVQRLSERGIPVQAHYFADEGHGFRVAANQQQVLEQEWAFYLNLLPNAG